MKSVYEKFTEEEHKTLLQRKGNTSWHDYILSIGDTDDKKN